MQILTRWMTEPAQPKSLSQEETLNQQTTKTGLKSRYKNIYQIMGSPKFSLYERYIQGKGKLSDRDIKEILGRYHFVDDKIGLAAKATYTSLCLIEKVGVNYRTKEGRTQVKNVLQEDVERAHPFIQTEIKIVQRDYILLSIVRWLESEKEVILTDRELQEIADDFAIEPSDLATELGRSKTYANRVEQKVQKLYQELERLHYPPSLPIEWQKKQSELEKAMTDLEAQVENDFQKADALYQQYNTLAVTKTDTKELREKLLLIKLEYEEIEKRLNGTNGLIEKLKHLEKEYQNATSPAEYQNAVARHREKNREKIQELSSTFYQISNPLVLSKTEEFSHRVIRATTLNFPLPPLRTEEEIIETLKKALAKNSNLLILNTLEELDNIIDPLTNTSLLEKLLSKATDPTSMRTLLLETLADPKERRNKALAQALQELQTLLNKN